MTAIAQPPIVDSSPSARPRFAWAPVVIIAACTTAVLLALSARYGVHRDEFYYLAGGRRLAWGFADHPPLTPLLARFQAEVFGTSTTAFRVLPSLAAGFAIVMSALIARELGGRRTAQVLAAVGAALLPVVRGPHLLFGTTSTDQVFWAIVLLLSIRLLRTRDTRWWLAIGAAAGLGLMNKHTILFALIMLVGGLLCTSERVLLFNRNAVLGGLVALVVWVPNLWWQFDNGVPALDMSKAIRDRNGGYLGGLPDFALETVALWAVFGLVLAWWGARWLLRDPAGRRWRALAIGAGLVVPLIALSGGKSYYAAPLALLLLPAASVAVESDGSRRRSFLTIVIVGGVISSVVTLPLLPADRLDAIVEVHKEYGEMIGWHDLADQVGEVHAGLTPDEQERAVIFTSNYGEAGALELYGPERGLPPVYSGHNSYADWAVPADDAVPVIVVGIPPERLSWCVDPVQVATITNRYGIDNDEAGEPIVVCHQLTDTWSNLWPSLRHVN